MVPPEDGYGPADASSRLEVPKAQIPSEAQRVGAHLMARSAEGQERPVVVTEVRETTVVLDLNDPLAGKTLLFDVRILGIEPPASTAPPPASRPHRPDNGSSGRLDRRLPDHAADPNGGRDAGLLCPRPARGRWSRGRRERTTRTS